MFVALMVENENSHLIFYLCKKSNNIKEQFLQKMLKLEIYYCVTVMRNTTQLLQSVWETYHRTRGYCFKKGLYLKCISAIRRLKDKLLRSHLELNKHLLLI